MHRTKHTTTMRSHSQHSGDTTRKYSVYKC